MMTTEKEEKQEMEKEIEKEIEKKLEQKFSCNNSNYNKNYNRKRFAANDAVYGLGFLGAAIFYISNATTFWMGLLGFLKAIVWPAFMVYEAFNFLIK